MDEPDVIRDRVNGKAKYCRIPIRRRRTPLYSYELEEFLYKYSGKEGVFTETIEQDAAALIEQGQYEEAGLLLSVLDFIKLFERIAFADEVPEA